MMHRRLILPTARRPPLPRPIIQPLFLRRPSSSTANVPRTALCPTCRAPLPPASASAPPSATCPSCSAFLPVPSPSPSFFTLLSQPVSYRIDRSGIKRNFLQWQQRVHPDLVPRKAREAAAASAKGGEGGDGGGRGEARVRAVQEALARDWSSIVNKANTTLSNDLARAEYMLAQVGVEIGEEDAVSDPELLMSVLEVREELENASSEDEVAAIRARNRQDREAVVERLAQAFSSEPARLEEARTLTIRLRYLENIETACREWAPGKRVELQH